MINFDEELLKARERALKLGEVKGRLDMIEKQIKQILKKVEV